MGVHSEGELVSRPLLDHTAVYTDTVDGVPHCVYVLPIPPPPPPHRTLIPSFVCTILLLLLLASVASFFLLTPGPLAITVSDLDLSAIHFTFHKGDSGVPQLFLNLALDVRMQVDNPNFFDVTYDSVSISTLYRGGRIGEVASSHGGNLDARSISSVDATLELSSYRIATNVLSMLEDIANRALPLQTVTEFDGYQQFVWFQIPLKGKVICNILVDPQDQIVRSQECDVDKAVHD